MDEVSPMAGRTALHSFYRLTKHRSMEELASFIVRTAVDVVGRAVTVHKKGWL